MCSEEQIVCPAQLNGFIRCGKETAPLASFLSQQRRMSISNLLQLPALVPCKPSRTSGFQGSTQSQKTCFYESIGSDEYYSIVEMTLENLLSTVKQRQSLVQGRAEEAAVNAVVIVVYCCCCCVGMLLCRHVIQAITTLIETHAVRV